MYQKLEKVQEHHQKDQIQILWSKNQWDCKQEVQALGANELDQKTKTSGHRNNSVQ